MDYAEDRPRDCSVMHQFVEIVACHLMHKPENAPQGFTLYRVVGQSEIRGIDSLSPPAAASHTMLTGKYRISIGEIDESASLMELIDRLWNKEDNAALIEPTALATRGQYKKRVTTE